MFLSDILSAVNLEELCTLMEEEDWETPSSVLS